MKILTYVSVAGMFFAAVSAFAIAEKLMAAGMVPDAWILRAAGVALAFSIPAPIYLAALEKRKEGKNGDLF